MSTAQICFTAGAAIFVAAGGAHGLLALADTVRPTWFAPNDDEVRRAMEGTGMRFRRPFPGDGARPSLWSFWLGFNVSHGLGAFAFGLLCLLLAAHDFSFASQIRGLMPITVAVAASYFAIAVRYWFGAIMLMTGAATALFAAAALLSL